MIRDPALPHRTLSSSVCSRETILLFHAYSTVGAPSGPATALCVITEHLSWIMGQVGLAAVHGHVTRASIIDDALHQAGLADAGFPLDHQHRRPSLAEPAKSSRRQCELGLPPNESLRRGHPHRLLHAGTGVQPKSRYELPRQWKTGSPSRTPSSAAGAKLARKHARRCALERSRRRRRPASAALPPGCLAGTFGGPATCSIAVIRRRRMRMRRTSGRSRSSHPAATRRPRAALCSLSANQPARCQTSSLPPVPRRQLDVPLARPVPRPPAPAAPGVRRDCRVCSSAIAQSWRVEEPDTSGQYQLLPTIAECGST